MKILGRTLATPPMLLGLGLVAAAAISAFVLLLRLPQAPEKKGRNPRSAAVELSRMEGEGAGDRLREEVVLRDPTPLFLPTDLNSAQTVSPESRLREPGDSFAGYSAKFIYQDRETPLPLPDPVATPARPAEELARTSWDRPFPGIGQSKEPVAPLSSRAALLSISAAQGGGFNDSLVINDLVIPENLDYRPCEFLVQANATGLVGAPPLLQSSGSDVVDRLFGDYLANHWAWVEQKTKIPPGSYRIIMGP